MFNLFRKLFNRNAERAAASKAAREARDKADAEMAEAIRAAQFAVDDNNARRAYYKRFDADRLRADQKAGIAADPLPEADLYAHYVTPPPTPEQWATLTPEQKRDIDHPVMFKD